MTAPASQQSIVAEWDAGLQRIATQLMQLLAEAKAGCEQLIAQNENDLLPLDNALRAIKQQVADLSRQVGRSIDEVRERSNESTRSHMRQAQREFERWADEQWMRFAAGLYLAQDRVLWPHVQAAMARGVACTRCGAPLARTNPRANETIPCASCQAVNQVVPDAMVAKYFASMPHHRAEAAVIDLRLAIRKLVEDFKERGIREEPIEHLRQYEHMETAYWTTYAEVRVQLEGGGADDVKTMVAARMKPIHDELDSKDAWRIAHGVPTMAELRAIPDHLANVDDWGPIDPKSPTALEDDYVHDQMLFRAMREPARHDALLAQLGYRGPLQRAMTHATCRRHLERGLTPQQQTEIFQRAMQRASDEEKKLAAHQAESSGRMEPIEGISLATYAALEKQLATLGPDAFAPVLARHRLDVTKWDRVRRAWCARMQQDLSGAVGNEYYRAYAGADVATTHEVTFERFCEINGAMAAWRKQGKDVAASLDRHFQMSESECSTISAHWMQKATTDPALAVRIGPLIDQFEKSYLQRA